MESGVPEELRSTAYQVRLPLTEMLSVATESSRGMVLSFLLRKINPPLLPAKRWEANPACITHALAGTFFRAQRKSQ
jgi:hypothetical protein